MMLHMHRHDHSHVPRSHVFLMPEDVSGPLFICMAANVLQASICIFIHLFILNHAPVSMAIVKMLIISKNMEGSTFTALNGMIIMYKHEPTGA